MASSGNRQTLSADGDTLVDTYFGPVHLSITGGFGGGTAKLQIVDPSGAAIDVAGGSFTAITDTYFDFPPGTRNQLTVNVASSTTPTLVIIIRGQSKFGLD